MTMPLPPRDALPRDVIVPVLPGLGTTWYDRGPRYWGRRAAVSFMWALVTALITLITIGLLTGIRHTSVAGFYAGLGVEVAYSLGIVVFTAIRTARAWDTPAPAPRTRGRATGPGRTGPAKATSTMGQALLIPSFLFTGLYLAMFVASLLPQTLVERQARLAIAGTLRERGQLPRT